MADGRTVTNRGRWIDTIWPGAAAWLWRLFGAIARTGVGACRRLTARSNHAHAVVEAEARPERVMNEFKAHASRELNRLARDEPNRKRWARHGSTRWLSLTSRTTGPRGSRRSLSCALWKDQDVRNAVRYVVEDQGAQMAVFVAEELEI